MCTLYEEFKMPVEINDEEKQSIPSDFRDLELQVAADEVTDSRNAAKYQ